MANFGNGIIFRFGIRSFVVCDHIALITISKWVRGEMCGHRNGSIAELSCWEAVQQLSVCALFGNLLPIVGWHTFLFYDELCGFWQHTQGGNTALISAAQNGNLDCVHLLVGAGADKEARDDVRPASFGVGFVFEAGIVVPRDMAVLFSWLWK